MATKKPNLGNFKSINTAPRKVTTDTGTKAPAIETARRKPESKTENTERFTVYLPPDLDTEVRMLAVKQKVRINEIYLMGLRMVVEKYEREK